MPPALGAVADDLQMPAGLPAHRADPVPALAQAGRDDHALRVEADVGHGRPPSRRSIRLNAVTARMSPSFARLLTLNGRQPASKGGSASKQNAQVANDTWRRRSSLRREPSQPQPSSSLARCTGHFAPLTPARLRFQASTESGLTPGTHRLHPETRRRPTKTSTHRAPNSARTGLDPVHSPPSKKKRQLGGDSDELPGDGLRSRLTFEHKPVDVRVVAGLGAVAYV